MVGERTDDDDGTEDGTDGCTDRGRRRRRDAHDGTDGRTRTTGRTTGQTDGRANRARRRRQDGTYFQTFEYDIGAEIVFANLASPISVFWRTQTFPAGDRKLH